MLLCKFNVHIHCTLFVLCSIHLHTATFKDNLLIIPFSCLAVMKAFSLHELDRSQILHSCVSVIGIINGSKCQNTS